MQTHLLERDFLCPNCARKIPSLDKLIIDKPTRARVHEYVDSEIEKSRQEAEKADKQEAAEEKPQADGASADGEKVRLISPPARSGVGCLCVRFEGRRRRQCRRGRRRVLQ